MSKRPLVVPIVFACALVLSVPAGPAQAGVYPGNKCVSSKIKEAGKKCGGLLKAWSTWDKTQNAGKRDLKIAKVVDKFTQKWGKADDKAAKKGVDCAETTTDVASAEALVDAAVASIVADVNTGLALPSKCGAKLLKEAAKKCDKLLKAYGKFIKSPAKDPQRAKLDDANAKVSTKFDDKFQGILDDGCATTATTAGVEATIDQLRDDIRAATTISPNVSDTQFDTITHPGPGEPGFAVDYDGETITPRCQSTLTLDLARYSFFVKRGTENKLLMYYQGGGVCWSGATCCLNTCDQDVDENGSDNPNNGFGTGFADLNNPNNPFRNWNVVFVSYCSCDIHTGDNNQTYSSPVCQALAGVTSKDVQHRGYDNAKLAEKFAREHFLDPDEVFVTGSSAGAFGAQTHVTPLARIYAASNVNMLADAGTFEPTQAFVDSAFPNWGLPNNFDKLKLEGVDASVVNSPLLLEGTLEAVARTFPNVNIAQFVAQYDGGTGGLGGFYHVMLNDTNTNLTTVTTVWPRWWDSSCAYHASAAAQMANIEAVTSGENDNYRYYFGSGSRHTMFGSNKVYDSTLGGVDTVVDFINKERIKPTDPSWTTQVASPGNVLVKSCSGGTNNGESCPNGITDCPDQGGGTSCATGDPQPSPLECPFKTSGADTVVDCTTCP
jgi:Pectinacetylesterase